MANTKESRVIRTRNVQDGTISFLDKKAGKTVMCIVRDLFPDLEAEWDPFWLDLPIIVRHLILHGINGKVGDTVAAKDKNGPETMTASWKALCANIWSQGGGGSPLDTYTVVLREMVSDALVSTGTKRVEADKVTRDDPAAAYMGYIEHLTPKGTEATRKKGFDNVWPKVQAAAKTEAARRDKAAPVDVSALLAAATQDKAA